MNPLEALALLDQIVSQVQMNRDSHGQAFRAVQVLGKAITPAAEDKLSAPALVP